LSSEDRDLLKRYLLGGLSEEEREALRERVLESNEQFELIREVEDDLIDDYASGRLQTRERAAVEQFLRQSGQLGRIDAARALAVSARGRAAKNNWAVWPMAAAIVLCIALAILALTLRSQRDEAESKLLAKVSSRVGGSVVTLRLEGESFRGSGDTAKAAVQLRDAIGTLILELPGVTDGGTPWRAEVESYGGARKVGGGWGSGPVTLAIPASAMTAGRYRIEVRRENGDLISAHEFTVER
jgi:hypothetical protein